jgi:hypothetical protein
MFGGILAWGILYKPEWVPSFKYRLDRWLTIILYRQPREFAGKTLSNVMAIFGLTLLLFGFFKIDKGLSFPGKLALLPVLGAVLIILAGQQAWVNRTILSNRLVVWFGLISFPLYLWHWVLLSFPRIIQGEFPNRSTRIVVIFISIILSWLTYKLIERPLRFGGYGKIKTAILLLLMISFGLIGYGTFLKAGLAFRKDAHLQNSRSGDTGHIEYHKYYLVNGFSEDSASDWRLLDKALTDWLFIDDGFGKVTNPLGIATREEVFRKWKIRNSDRLPASKVRSNSLGKLPDIL